MVGTMSTINDKGDTKLMWNSDNADEVAAAQAMFDELVGEKKFLAYAATGNDGLQGEQIREFDPEMERIILVPQMQGG